ncbi:uncharacterized protein LOC122257463 [Penaeus japonicus]|uniref:uncharacterized protein LOC122257463 n=1 Tax=Penaeus japonicus TaxID=27405 RepID=UPI001C715347|nr:uncharacterized protein LOC122257463 [Penaeus japonicus]
MLAPSTSLLRPLVPALCLLLALDLQAQVEARQAFKGDPGALGDTGFDLSQYKVSDVAKSRAKRYFVSFPSSSTLTFNNKIKVPLFKKFDSNISGVFKGVIKATYTLPSDTITVGRGIDEDRLTTYNSIETVFTNFGIDGHQCLLKAICETAETAASEYGLIGELLGLLLSPNHALGHAKDDLLEYTAAESYGRDVGNCDLAYSSCPLTLGELLKTGVSLLQGSVSRFAGF